MKPLSLLVIVGAENDRQLATVLVHPETATLTSVLEAAGIAETHGSLMGLDDGEVTSIARSTAEFREWLAHHTEDRVHAVPRCADSGFTAADASWTRRLLAWEQGAGELAARSSDAAHAAFTRVRGWLREAADRVAGATALPWLFSARCFRLLEASSVRFRHVVTRRARAQT